MFSYFLKESSYFSYFFNQESSFSIFLNNNAAGDPERIIIRSSAFTILSMIYMYYAIYVQTIIKIMYGCVNRWNEIQGNIL